MLSSSSPSSSAAAAAATANAAEVDSIPYAIKSQITKISYSDPNFTSSVLKRASDFAVASAFHALITNTSLETLTIRSSKFGEVSLSCG